MPLVSVHRLLALEVTEYNGCLAWGDYILRAVAGSCASAHGVGVTVHV